jgi:hypothetical protein
MPRILVPNKANANCALMKHDRCITRKDTFRILTLVAKSPARFKFAAQGDARTATLEARSLSINFKD